MNLNRRLTMTLLRGCSILLYLMALFVQPIIATDTYRFLALRVSFPPETPDNETTSGNGTFDLSTAESSDRIYPFDAPPHDRAYFEAHLQALSNYYRDISQGQLTIEYDVYPQDPTASYVLDTPLIEYGNGRTRREINERVTRLFRDGIRAADAADGTTIDFSKYHAFAVFHAGLGGEAGQKLNDIPSAFIFKRDLIEFADGAIAVNNGAFQVTSGMLLPEAISTNGQGGLNGTLARFFASQLGLPGLSDFENDLPAIGDWSLMDTGANNQIDAARLGLQPLTNDPTSTNLIGFLPSRLTAWSRIQLGWLEPLVITHNDTVEIAASGSASDLPQAIRVPISATEYFLIENRISRLNIENRIPQIEFSTPHNVWLSSDDYDAFIPGSGILIYHIDDAIIRASDAEKHINSHPDYKVAPAQYRRGIALEEADGLQDIGNVSASRIIQAGIISLSSIEGAPEDAFYVGNNALFGPDTSPNTRSNLGYESGITIEVLSPPGDVMTVAIRFANRLDNWPITDLNPTRESPRVIDLDGEGIKEILHSSGAWKIAGTQHSTDESFATTPAIGDPEIAGFIYHRGETTRTHWRPSGTVHETVDIPSLSSFSSTPVIAKFPTTHVDIWGWSDGKIEWGNFLSEIAGNIALSDAIQSLAVGNIDSDSDNELIAITSSAQIHLIHDTGHSTPLATFASPIIGGPAIGDLDRDGNDDIAVVTADGILSILDANGLAFASDPVPGGAHSPPVVADLDRDGFIEVLFGGNGKLYLYRFNAILQTEGALALPIKDGAGPIEAPPILADINNDTTPDIFAGTRGGLLYGLTAEGHTLPGFPLLVPGPILSSPLIDDLDNDSTLELIIYTANGSMHLFHLETIDPSYTGNKIIWGQLGGGPGNAGKLLQQPLEIATPTDTSLLPAARAYLYPNPIRNGDRARIRFFLLEPAEISMTIYNPLGEKIADLTHDNPMPNTDNEIAWDVADYASGLYICRLQASNSTRTEVRFIKAAIIK
ncbi:MAG: T9SS type A sorting domain-containing protein [Gemmatimonadetes bacterium]|nr:T9SS type A sorting domain-containing protein [Gemmatimonadota bacterium]